SQTLSQSVLSRSPFLAFNESLKRLTKRFLVLYFNNSQNQSFGLINRSSRFRCPGFSSSVGTGGFSVPTRNRIAIIAPHQCRTAPSPSQRLPHFLCSAPA